MPEAQTDLPAVITGQRSGLPETQEEDRRLAASHPCHEGLAQKQEGPLESAVLSTPAMGDLILPLPQDGSLLILTPPKHSLPVVLSGSCQGFLKCYAGASGGPPSPPPQPEAGVRGGGGEVWEVRAEGMRAILTSPGA